MAPQLAQRDRVERARGDPAVDSETVDTSDQLARGLAGERDRQNVASFDARFSREVCDAPGQDTGLARPGRRDDREGRDRRGDRLVLCGIEVVEQRVAHTPTVHTSCAHTLDSIGRTRSAGLDWSDRIEAGRGKAPSSLRRFRDSDLLGTLPSGAESSGYPRRRPADRHAGPCSSPPTFVPKDSGPRFGSRTGTHVRPFRSRKRVQSPTHRRTGKSGHYDRATRASSRIFRDARLDARLGPALFAERSHGAHRRRADAV
jgi:hypothetical protein